MYIIHFMLINVIEQAAAQISHCLGAKTVFEVSKYIKKYLWIAYTSKLRSTVS